MSHLINVPNNEFNDLLKAISSVKKEIVIAGKKVFIWKERVLFKNGQLMPLDEYMIQSGERVLLNPAPIERNTREEIKDAKKDYADSMEKKYGSNWRSEKKGAVVKLTTFRQLSILLK